MKHLTFSFLGIALTHRGQERGVATWRWGCLWLSLTAAPGLKHLCLLSSFSDCLKVAWEWHKPSWWLGFYNTEKEPNFILQFSVASTFYFSYTFYLFIDLHVWIRLCTIFIICDYNISHLFINVCFAFCSLTRKKWWKRFIVQMYFNS